MPKKPPRPRKHRGASRRSPQRVRRYKKWQDCPTEELADYFYAIFQRITKTPNPRTEDFEQWFDFMLGERRRED